MWMTLYVYFCWGFPKLQVGFSSHYISASSAASSSVFFLSLFFAAASPPTLRIKINDPIYLWVDCERGLPLDYSLSPHAYLDVEDASSDEY